MDQAIIDQKLESLRRCVHRLETHCPDSTAALAADLDAQDIIALNLTRAIQLCVDIAAYWLAEQPAMGAPQSMGQSFTLLAEADRLNDDLAMRLRKAVGFRNIVIHSYEPINWNIVFHLCTERLADFREFAIAFSV